MGLTLLSTLERDHPDLAAEVRAKLSENTSREYDTLATLRWVTMKAHMDLSDHIRAAVGSTNNADFWRRASLEVLNRPLLGFVQTFTKLMGTPPKVLVRVAPVILPQLFKHIGTFTMRTVEEEDHFAVGAFRGFPASEYSLMCFVEGVSGSLVSAGHVVGIEVEVTRLFVDAVGDFDLAIRRNAP